MKKVFKNLFLGLMAAGVVFAGCKLDETDNSALLAAAAAAGSGSSASVVQTKTITGISISNETTTVKTGTSKVSIGIKCKYSDNTWSELSEDEISELTSDDTLIISIEDADADGDGVDCTSKIKSGNKLIPGTVEGEIQVKALYEKNGSKFVSKKTFTISASAVVEKALDHVELTGITSPVKLSASSVALGAKAYFTDSTDEDVTSSATFTSSDTSVAEVSGTSLVLKKAGETTVKVSYTYNNVEKTASTVLKVQDNDVTLTSIAFGNTASEVTYGSSVELFVNATYSDNSTSKVTGNVTYTLSSTTYAAIDGSTLSNKNTSTDNVSVTVTASYEGKTAEKTFTLKKKAVASLSSIEITNTNTELANGGSVELAVKAIYDDGSKEDVTAESYSLSDTTYAAVSGSTLSNKNTTSSTVTVTVTATYNGKTATKTFTLKGSSSPVYNVLTLSKEKVELAKGATVTLTATAGYSDGSSKVVTTLVKLESSDTSVVTVASDGTITAVAAGTATVTATYGNYSATCTVTVTDPSNPVTGITAKVGTDNTIIVNSSADVVVTATYKDGTTKTVTPTSVTLDNTKATVSGAKITAGDTAGSCEATVTYKEGDVTVTTTVTIKVAAKQLKSIAITATPTSIAYNGTSTLKVTATYEDDTTADVTANTIFNAKINGSETSVLSITKSGSGATATANNTETTAKIVTVTATFASTASPKTATVDITVGAAEGGTGSGTIGFDFN